ncbi:M23 family metallopeptidase [Gracilinema caldarium]|uniref:M23 family metallopeptidase n=1 Tax=Gracilinema caldarium TaxID=215591 RepID=UPI0026E9F973|nr:M23 family metallopeptidase [Gracilinema caldarium]
MMKKKLFYKSFFVLIFPLLTVLLGSGIFQSREAKTLALQDELSPGSPVTVVLAIPVPQGASAAPSESTKESSLLPGDLIPLRVQLLNEHNKRMLSAPFFYYDRIQKDGTDYTVYLALLVIPNTYEGSRAYLDIRTDTGGANNNPGISDLKLPPRIQLSITKKAFNAETIALGPANTDIKTKPDPQKDKEAAELWKLLVATKPGLYTTGTFAMPVDSNRRTSFFGDRRIYQYSNGTLERTIHGGIDFGVPKGTVVRATAPALVQMARFRIVTGNTVILQHAPAVYSIYYHMDSLSVKEGDLIDTGTEIGKSGSTGLSTGPHLHWEFRIQGEFADPDLMVQTAPLDKDRILSKIVPFLENNTDRSAEGR